MVVGKSFEVRIFRHDLSGTGILAQKRPEVVEKRSKYRYTYNHIPVRWSV